MEREGGMIEGEESEVGARGRERESDWDSSTLRKKWRERERKVER